MSENRTSTYDKGQTGDLFLSTSLLNAKMENISAIYVSMGNIIHIACRNVQTDVPRVCTCTNMRYANGKKRTEHESDFKSTTMPMYNYCSVFLIRQ